MPDVLLNSGEAELVEWQPSLRVFLGKIIFVGLLTALLLGGFKFWLPLWDQFILLPFMIVYFIVLFGDWQEWFNRRCDRWTLTNERLILSTPLELHETASVRLDDIQKIRRWMWWALVVRFKNGQAATMSFLNNPKAVRDRILHARDTLERSIE